MWRCRPSPRRSRWSSRGARGTPGASPPARCRARRRSPTAARSSRSAAARALLGVAQQDADQQPVGLLLARRAGVGEPELAQQLGLEQRLVQQRRVAPRGRHATRIPELAQPLGERLGASSAAPARQRHQPRAAPVGELGEQGTVGVASARARAVRRHAAGADRDPAGAEFDAEPAATGQKPAGRPAARRRARRSRSAREPPASAACASRISAVTDAAAAARLQPGALVGRPAAPAAPPRPPRRCRRPLGDLDRDGVATGSGDRRVSPAITPPHTRRAPQAARGDRPGRLHDRLAERRDRDRDRTTARGGGAATRSRSSPATAPETIVSGVAGRRCASASRPCARPEAVPRPRRARCMREPLTCSSRAVVTPSWAPTRARARPGIPFGYPSDGMSDGYTSWPCSATSPISMFSCGHPQRDEHPDELQQDERATADQTDHDRAAKTCHFSSVQLPCTTPATRRPRSARACVVV